MSNHFQIRHRTPPYVLVGSDYSQQEPKILGYVAQDPEMIRAFSEGKDIYATIASIAFGVPYEECLEFHPDTHEYQKDGKERRSSAKTIVLGVSYGRSVNTIAEQLFGKDETLTDEEKVKKAQHVYDAVMNAFPNLRQLMITAQQTATQKGYVETILGRRRHIPDMMLPPFEFKPLAGYVNPDIDPLDPSTLQNKEEIPRRIVEALQKEYAGFKYNGQRYKRTKQLYDEEHIKVIDNRSKIADASRECVNSVIQGSASELTKMAILKLINDPRWKAFGGRLLVPVHDELIAEVPLEYAEDAGNILTECMCEAGNFLPFTISCDLETTERWYGLSLESIVKHEKPKSFDNLSEDNIKWIQCHLCEMEYVLPIFNDEDGNKPRGDAAHGVSGQWSVAMDESIEDYCRRYRILKDSFFDDIESRVQRGYVHIN